MSYSGVGDREAGVVTETQKTQRKTGTGTSGWAYLHLSLFNPSNPRNPVCRRSVGLCDFFSDEVADFGGGHSHLSG